MNPPNLLLTPIRHGVPQQGGTLEVLIRVQAPAQSPVPVEGAAARAPLRLALVVDRSGSMDGDPLRQAVRCVEHIATRLQPTDQVAVVLYDHTVQVPVPLQAAGVASAVQEALAGVHSGGNTALFNGWEAGARQLEAGTADAVSRVILLSDGQANNGLVDPVEIQKHCAQWLARGVSTTTVGLGRAFNEDLMIGMAQAGGGQQYYGQTAEDLFDGFDEELALLEALYLRQLRIKLVPAAGVIAEPLGVVRAGPEGWLALSDLAWGAESWLLVRLHLAADAVVSHTPRALLAVHLEAQGKSGDVVAMTSPVLALPAVDADAFSLLTPEELVARRLMEIDFADAAARARVMIQDGEFEQAKAYLATLEAKVSTHPWLTDKLKKLQALTAVDPMMSAKEIRYGQMKASRRLAQSAEVAFCVSETDDASIPAFLRRKSAEGEGRRR